MANELHKFQCSRHRQYNGNVMKLTFFQSHQSLLIFVGTFFSWACYVRSGHKLWPTTVFWWRMLRHRSKNEVHKFDYIIDTWIHDMTTHSHNSLKIYCYSNAKWTTCKMFMVEYFPVDWNWIVTGYTQNILFFWQEWRNSISISTARVKVGSFVVSPCAVDFSECEKSMWAHIPQEKY